jgi:hypothetical protein
MDNPNEYLDCLQQITDLFQRYCKVQKEYLQEKDPEKIDALSDELYRVMFDHYRTSNKLKELFENLSLENPESLKQFSNSLEQLAIVLNGFDDAMTNTDT